MSSRPPRRVVARPIAPPPDRDHERLAAGPSRPPTRHPLLLAGLIVSGLAFLLVIGAGVAFLAVRSGRPAAVESPRVAEVPAPARLSPTTPTARKRTRPPIKTLTAGYEEIDLMADARFAPLLTDATPPLPQDAEAMKRVRSTATEGWRQATVGVFEVVGKTAPWAEKARAALQLGADERATWDRTGSDDPAARQAAAVALRAAADAGCDDPLVRCWLIQQPPAPGQPDAADFAAEAAAVERLLASPYPEPVRLRAVASLLRTLKPANDANAAATWRKRFAELYGRVAKSPGRLAEGAAWVATEQFLHAATDLSADDRLAFLDKALAGAPAPRRQLFHGRALDWAGWHARGPGFEKDVPPEQHAEFIDRLREAEAELEAVAAADPTGWRAPALLITVCMGLSAPRPVMERWFAWAMAANPDSAEACERKGVYLLPRWHGTREALDAFVWQCVKSGNTTGRLPEAAVRVALDECPVAGPDYDKERLPVHAWYNSTRIGHATMRGIEAQLRASPEDTYLRSLRARLLAFRGRVTAHPAFTALGADYDRTVFPDPDEYAAMRQSAEDAWRASGGD